MSALFRIAPSAACDGSDAAADVYAAMDQAVTQWAEATREQLYRRRDVPSWLADAVVDQFDLFSLTLEDAIDSADDETTKVQIYSCLSHLALSPTSPAVSLSLVLANSQFRPLLSCGPCCRT